MSIRKNPIVTGSYYYAFNRTYQFSPFVDFRLSNRALFCIWYLNIHRQLSVSNYLSSSIESQTTQLKQLEQQPKKNDILSFCFMPNHFHFLIRQNQDDGITKFIGDFQNTITQYFNIKHKRKGPLFERQFKAVLIEKEEVLLHISRYIHLNPFSANLIHTIEEIATYPYSSLKIYLDPSTNSHAAISIELINSYFPNHQKHLDFISDQAEYQKSLHYLSKLLIDH